MSTENERIVRLETKMESLENNLQDMKESLSEVNQQLTELERAQIEGFNCTRMHLAEIDQKIKLWSEGLRSTRKWLMAILGTVIGAVITGYILWKLGLK